MQIMRNYDSIKLHLNVDDVLPLMFSRGYFTKHVFDKINSHQHCSAKITALIDLLYTFTNTKFEEFLEILEEMKQEALANEIRKTDVRWAGKSLPDPSVVMPSKKPKDGRLSKRTHSCVNLVSATEDTYSTQNDGQRMMSEIF